jgi:hypothetical protein
VSSACHFWNSRRIEAVLPALLHENWRNAKPVATTTTANAATLVIALSAAQNEAKETSR